MECVCDYEPAIFYVESEPVARKPHRCAECFGWIEIGEKHWTVRAQWFRGEPPQTLRRCPECAAIAAYVKAHVPCFCDLIGGLEEEVRGTLDAYWKELHETGVRFYVGRLVVQSKKRRRGKERR
jgi:hypothetical protein